MVKVPKDVKLAKDFFTSIQAQSTSENYFKTICMAKEYRSTSGWEQYTEESLGKELCLDVLQLQKIVRSMKGWYKMVCIMDMGSYKTNKALFKVNLEKVG